MSGIAGVLSHDLNRQPVRLEQMGRLLSHGPSFAVTPWRQGALGLVYASVRPSTDRLDVSSQEGVSLFVTGEAYNVSEIWQARTEASASGSVGQVRSRAQLLLDLYLAQGLRPFAELNGAFVLGVWDERQRTLYLMTDRLGLRKLYYARSSNALVFSSEVKAILCDPEVSRSIDAEGMAHMLALGHLLNDRTLYASIRLLRGGVVLTYQADANAVALEPYWEAAYRTRGHHRSLVECADELATRVEAAVSRQIDGARRIGIPLSGGLDSRTVLGFARKLRPDDPLQTFSVGHRHAYDVVFARRLARVCRTQHRYIPLETDFLARRAMAFAWLTDGMVSVHNGWLMSVYEPMAACCDHMLVGFLGDVLNGYALMKPVREPIDPEALYREYNVAFSGDDLEALLRPQLFRQIDGVTARDYRRCVHEAQTDDPADRAVLAEVLQRQQRNTSVLLTLFGSSTRVSTPFADNDVVDFLTTVPWRYRFEKQAYQEMIRRHLPRLARVSVDKTGLPLDAGRIRSGLHWRWERLTRRHLPRLTGGRWHPHDRWAYAHVDEWMRMPAMRIFIERQLKAGERYWSEWFQPDEVWRVWQRHLHGANLSHRISVLLTLSLWFEREQHAGAGGLSSRGVGLPSEQMPLAGVASAGGFR